MHKRLWWLAGLTLALSLSLYLPHLAAAPKEDVSGTLFRQTQELMDATSDGKASVWDRYLDPALAYTNEEGEVLTKQKLVGDTKPFPAGISGTIKVTDFKAIVHGTVAVATHVDDEHENYHGAMLHCQYRTTDIWQKTPAGWRLIAGQVMPLRADPRALQVKPAQLDEYVGRYSLTPQITYEIRRTATGLEGQQTGHKPETLLVEAPDDLFVPGKFRYRNIFQRAADGHITGFAERREAWDIIWARVKQSPSRHLR
ncbi:MAG TPA: nuclear transport factor 2 family protein [Thermoanaerobaculia bacterium]|jgi:ketosteroid isomerase-like protein|nr:nuclear transport factor 2 family protein [Thermoanaerobaculia bacterium]